MHLALLPVALAATFAITIDVATDFASDLDTLVARLATTHPEFAQRCPAATWEPAVASLRSRLAGMTPAQFALEAAALVARLADGHSRVELEATAAWGATLPVRFRRFEEGLFVTAAAPEHAALVGHRVTRLGAREIEPLLQDARALLSGDNPPSRDAFVGLALISRAALEFLGAGRADLPLEIAVAEDDGGGGATTAMLATTVSGGAVFGTPAGWVAATPTAVDGPAAFSLRPRSPLRPFWFKCLADEWAVYCRIDAIADDPAEKFAAFVARLFAFIEENEIERLILDLRGNDGGDNYLVQPLIHAVLRCDRINRPGRLLVLIGPQTYSAAVNCASDLERETQALFLGQPAGAGPNHCGDAERFVLPQSRVPVRCSTVRWQKSDPRDRRTAMLPDVAVGERFADWSAGRDATLEAALAVAPDDAVAQELAALPPISHWTRPSQGRRR